MSAKFNLVLVCSFLALSLNACASQQNKTASYDNQGQIVSEDLNGRKAVEIYEIEPKDMSYVNFEPGVDHEVVQEDDVVVYDVLPREDRIHTHERKDAHNTARWRTLLSMWRGGLNIGDSLYDNDNRDLNE